MIKIGHQDLLVKDFNAVIFHNQKIEIAAEAMQKVHNSFDFLQKFSRDKLIYGINTGFGPMAQYRIEGEEQISLQYNLIRSHASGSGDLLSDTCVKASMLARLNTLLKGFSGVHPSVVLLLKDLINKDICPHIYAHGGVGASGDLVQLAHLALALIGEGKVNYQGSVRNAGELFKELNLSPIQITMREGLALMNGTSVMTGISLANLFYAKKILHYSLLLSCMLNEIMSSFDDHFSEELNATKQHKGQIIIAQDMRKTLSSSRLIHKRATALYQKVPETKILEKKVQEYYSLRCVPQILGPVFDTIAYTEEILMQEINSVNDNPVIDVEAQNVFHGGNFHGDYVALEADKLKIAITKLSMLSERQINFLMNHNINKILPPFVNLGKLGFNLGMQGIQFTAVSTAAENQTLSHPMSIHSIPNNNDNQDIVSMGTNASMLTSKIIHNTFEILAIEALSIAQAVDYLSIRPKMAQNTGLFYDKIRSIIPVFKEDDLRYESLKEIVNSLKNSDIE